MKELISNCTTFANLLVTGAPPEIEQQLISWHKTTPNFIHEKKGNFLPHPDFIHEAENSPTPQFSARNNPQKSVKYSVKEKKTPKKYLTDFFKIFRESLDH